MTNCDNDKVKIIEREYATLLKKLSEFEAIKKEIGVLMKRSSSDPRARAVLKEVRKTIPYSISTMEVKLRKDLEKVSAILKSFGFDINRPY